MNDKAKASEATVTPSAPGPRMILTTLSMTQSPSAFNMPITGAAKAKYVIDYYVTTDGVRMLGSWHRKEIPVNPFTSTLMVTLETQEESKVEVDVHYVDPAGLRSPKTKFSFWTNDFVPPLPPGFIDGQIHISHVEDAANFRDVVPLPADLDSPDLSNRPDECVLLVNSDESPDVVLDIELEKNGYVFATGESGQLGGDFAKIQEMQPLIGFFIYEEVGYTPVDPATEQVIHGQG